MLILYGKKTPSAKEGSFHDPESDIFNHVRKVLKMHTQTYIRRLSTIDLLSVWSVLNNGQLMPGDQ